MPQVETIESGIYDCSRCGALALAAQQSEEDVGSADVLVAVTKGFIKRQLKDAFRPGAERNRSRRTTWPGRDHRLETVEGEAGLLEHHGGDSGRCG